MWYPACKSTTAARSSPIREMRTLERTIDGQKRLFSTFGFWVLEDAIRWKIVACYDSEGRLDRVKLKEAVSPSSVIEHAEYVEIVFPQGPFSVVLMADGWLLSLDPAADSVVKEVEKSFRERKRLPIVPVLPRY